MENGQKNITLRAVEVDAEALDAFGALMRPGIDTGGSLQSVDDVLAGCSVFQWERGGEVLARHALCVNEYVHGAEGVIVGAVGVAPFGFEKTISIVEQQFVNVRAVRVHTARIGMVRQLARCGYKMRGFIMGKNILRGNS